MSPDDPKKTAKDIADAAGEAGTDASVRIRSVVDDVKGHASELAAKGRDAAADIAASAKQSLNDAADRIPKAASDAVDMGGQFCARGNAEVSRQVRKQPMEALLLAGAIGFLVGWAANRT